MLQNLRARIGRMGVVAAFLTLMFALTPSLEAVACAIEGCDFSCAGESTAQAAASEADSSPTDSCDLGTCTCIAGHCSHTALPAPAAFASIAVIAHARVAPVVAEQTVPATPQTPERPPRA